MVRINPVVKIGRPIWIPRTRVMTDESQVCINVIDLETQKENDPICYQFHKDDRVKVLFAKLSNVLSRIDDKQLEFEKHIMGRHSVLTFRELVGDKSEATIYAVCKNDDSAFSIKLEENGKAVQNRRSYVTASRQAQPLAIALHRQFTNHNVQDVAVRKGVDQLEMLKHLVVDTLENPAEWLGDIERILRQAYTPPTIIGIVGNTGAGKSSMLNALLDQPKPFIPTSSTRACTATITEMSYHDNETFRAVIEFVSTETWKTELDVLFDDHSVAEDLSNDEPVDTVAVRALAKLRTVYPFLHKGNLAQYTTEQLIADKTVSLLLGSQHVIDEVNVQDFHNRLKVYIDSGDKVDEMDIRYWPLIKIVRVYMKHSILADGVTLVDLPGSHDANAARGKIAEEYAINCSGYLAVSQINRATDDKFSKEVIEDNFRRQLSMDSGYFKHIVTIVCTKADDIDFDEFRAKLSGSAEFHELELQKRMAKEQVERLEEDLALLEEEIDTSGAEFDLLDTEVDDLGLLKNDLLANPDKAVIPWKGNMLTLKQVHHELNIMTSKKKEAGKTRKLKIQRKKDINLDKVLFKQKLYQADANIDVTCVEARQKEVERGVRHVFISEISDIDHDLAYKANAEHFNPDETLRDYGSLRQELPVFCISARAYQKSLGGSDHVKGFPGKDHSGIPQLQEHCGALALKARASTCDQFLMSLSELLNSLIIFSGHGTLGIETSTKQIKKQRDQCLVDIDEMNKSCGTEVIRFEQAFTKRLEAELSQSLVTAAREAKKQGREIVDNWNCNPKAFSAAIYRAICRRNGSFREPQHDWNTKLAKPLLEEMKDPWTTFFNETIEELLEEFTEACMSVLENDTIKLLENAENLGVEQIEVLKEQIKSQQKSSKLIKQKAIKCIGLRQREIRRMIIPGIEKNMLIVYAKCAKLTGKCSRGEMHREIRKHIDNRLNPVYSNVVKDVKAALKVLVGDIKALVLEAVMEVNTRITRDCLAVMTPLSAAQVQSREVISEFIDKAKADFKSILDSTEREQDHKPHNGDAGSAVDTKESQEKIVSSEDGSTCMKDEPMA